MSNWDIYSRRSVDLAGTVTSFGLTAARSATRLGFAVTRGIATTAAGISSTAVDLTLFGGAPVARPIVGGAVSTVLLLAERITMAPIVMGEWITSSSVAAAHSSINLLSFIFPGSTEASFSLASFLALVKREWDEPEFGEHLPEKKFSLTQVTRGIVAWVSLQGATREWEEKRWMRYLREIHVRDPKPSDFKRDRRPSRIRVTSDIILPNRGQIVAADIGEPTRSRRTSILSLRGSLGRSIRSPSMTNNIIPSPTNLELKATLRRLSKLVLAGYGGASLLFFGVSPMPYTPSTSTNSLPRTQKASEEADLANAIDASEAEASGQSAVLETSEIPSYAWWDVLMGKHDHDIFETYANSNPKTSAENSKAKNKTNMRATAVIGVEHQMPRFWVLTDHARGQIVLVLRGTMSLNEIAVDLTCEAEDFVPVQSPPSSSDTEKPLPGQYIFPGTEMPTTENEAQPTSYRVHSGMLRMAKAMGLPGKPVQIAVHEALHRNPDYDLVLSGHSLGAGVAALLGLLWADPNTCLTARSSGLPVGRLISVYCFAPPCIMDSALCKISSKLVVSFVYSHDVVSRLSLASVRDLKSAAMWLCDANERDSAKDKDCGEGYDAITSRVKRWKAGRGSKDDPDWFIAIRKTLEANMRSADLYPPGRVWWALRESDLHPSHRVPTTPSDTSDKLRLFEVLDVEKVFSQIVFARDMLSSHMPHQYDRVLHDLL